MFFKPRRLHFIGIGGIGMSGIAEVLLNLGYEVSGSDLRSTPITERLASFGARVFEGHAAEHVEGAKAVVVSSAIDRENPELLEARRRQLPIIPRGEMLAELMRLKYGIAIAGSHGKTTTTSMTAAVLSHAGHDPTVVVGGRVGTMGGSNARLGHSEYLVAESDESDGSFLKLAPIIAVITNIDREHLDHYPSIDEIRAAFIEFANKIPFYGSAIVCLDNENVQQILPSINRKTVTYGTNHQADLAITHIDCGQHASEFRLALRGHEVGSFRVAVPGVHNVLNATAAVAVGLELEVAPAVIAEGLEKFRGVDRRFQLRGEAAGVAVVDDYGHHPTEIRATLAAARLARYRRIHAIFQPHRYTRTEALMDDFAKSFHQADNVFVMDIYAASERPIEGVSAAALAGRMRDFGHRSAQYTPGMDQAVAAAVAAAGAGDLVLTLGAGNVWQAGDRILSALAECEGRHDG